MSLVVKGKSLRPYFTKLDHKFCFIGLRITYVLANGSKGTDREKRKASRPETVHGPEVWSHRGGGCTSCDGERRPTHKKKGQTEKEAGSKIPEDIRADPSIKQRLRRVMMKSQGKEDQSKFFQTRSLTQTVLSIMGNSNKKKG
jgi:hypothetical protein